MNTTAIAKAVRTNASGDLTWEQAEALFPGCSAAWDATRIPYDIAALYENAAGCITAFVPDAPYGERYMAFDKNNRWYMT